jgi:protocatechuate 3,4-dioxygenase beta subunit
MKSRTTRRKSQARLEAQGALQGAAIRKPAAPGWGTLKIVWLTSLMISVAAGPSRAATIRGTVLDPSNRAVPHARVSLLTPLAALEERQTDAQGRYDFTSLPGGEYTLVANMPGFSTLAVKVKLEGF